MNEAKHVAPKKVLFVCLGNICRSPMAEGIFRDLLRTQGIQGHFLHDSCGTGSWHAGSEPDRRAQACLLSHGIDVSDLRARQLTETDFREFDLILTMDDSNYEGCLSIAPDGEARQRVRKMLSYHGDPKLKEVPDPYQGGAQGFESVYQMLNVSCRNLLEELLRDQKSEG